MLSDLSQGSSGDVDTLVSSHRAVAHAKTEASTECQEHQGRAMVRVEGPEVSS